MKEKVILAVILIIAVFLRQSININLLISIVSVVGVWYLTGRFFPKFRGFKEMAALFLAVSPWHISLPAAANLGLFGVIWGVLILGKFLKGKWLYLLVVLLVLLGNQIISPFVVNLENAKDTAWLTDQQRREHKEDYNGLISKTFHNKGINYSLSFIEHWGEHFSADFLFVSSKNLMYLADLLFLIVGLGAVIKKGDWGNWGIVLVWLLVAPVNSSLHFAPPDSIKAVLMLVPLILISSYGAFVLLETVQRYVKGGKIK